jgi:hypothetical protein
LGYDEASGAKEMGLMLNSETVTVIFTFVIGTVTAALAWLMWLMVETVAEICSFMLSVAAAVLVWLTELKADTVTAIFTFVLAVATGTLAWLTGLLSANTKKDFIRRRTQDTVSAWSQVRNQVRICVPSGGFPKLDGKSKPNPELRWALAQMEFFAACVNSGVYDLEIFDRISGGWFVQQYDRIKSYVERECKNKRVYADLKELYKIISCRRGGGVVPDDDEILNDGEGALSPHVHC